MEGYRFGANCGLLSSKMVSKETVLVSKETYIRVKRDLYGVKRVLYSCQELSWCQKTGVLSSRKRSIREPARERARERVQETESAREKG